MNDPQWHSFHWETGGKPDGGVSYGTGFTIAWQRGSLLEVCLDELKHKHTQFPCQENIDALAHLENCLQSLNSRLDRRKAEGTLYDHKESPMYPTSQVTEEMISEEYKHIQEGR